MIIYLMKSTLLLGLLFGVYKLLLENEKMHRFNRFFLLFALAFGLTAPVITFEVNPEQSIAGLKMQHMERVVNAPAEVVSQSVESAIVSEPATATKTEIAPATPSETEGTISTADILFGLYGLITLFLMIRFVGGLLEIRNKIRAGTHQKTGPATLVLLNESITPQSFFRFIFLEKKLFEKGEIETEILDHELTHVRQLHTFDVLFVEFLKVIFWFNPFMYLYKQAIQLNHEFIADESVVSKVSSPSDYQEMLIRACAGNKPLSTTSSINFSLTKKRLHMMGKQISRTRSNSIKIFIAPVVLCLSLMFCTNQNTENGLVAYEFKGGVEGEMYESEPVLYAKEEKKFHDRDLFPSYPIILNENGEPFTGTRRFYNSNTNETGWEEVYNEGILTKTIYRNEELMDKRNVSYITYQFENGGYVAKTVYDTTKTMLTRSEYTDNSQRSYGPDGQLIFLGYTIDGKKWTYQKWWNLNGDLLMESSLARDSSGVQKLKSTLYDEEGNIKDQRYIRGQIRYY
ncbi:MAG: M56 family metallopeptidase [Balneolaceae bacterium]|nr:M56 family metallopeptidase [Balneolaceae bacterium]